MIKRTGYIVFCLILSSGYTSNSQELLNPQMVNQTRLFQRFSLADKGGSTVSSVFIDRKGFIWCGSESGLFRFDGKEFSKYYVGKSDTSIYGSAVLSILEDSEGNIWAGTYSALNCLTPGTGRIKHFFPDTIDYSGDNNSIFCIKEDTHGILWLITSKDIFSFNRHSEKFTRFPIRNSAWRGTMHPVNFLSERFFEDGIGRIWIGTEDGLYCYSDSTWRLYWPRPGDQDAAAGNVIKCITGDSAGNVWIGTGSYGLLKINNDITSGPEKVNFCGTVKMPGGIRSVNALFYDEKRILWVFGDNRLIKFDTYNSEVKYFTFSDIQSGRMWTKPLNINKIFKGREEDLWLMCLSCGMMFHFIPETEKLFIIYIPNWIDFDCARDSRGNIWIGAIYANLFRLNTGEINYQMIQVPHVSSPDFIHKRRIAEDGNGIIWMALDQGIFRLKPVYDGSLSLPEKFNTPYKYLKATSIYFDKKGDLWIGCDDGTAMKYSPAAKSFRLFIPEDTITDIGTVIILEDNDGDLWFARPYNGIYILRSGTEKMEKFLDYKELPGYSDRANLWDFTVDDDNQLWILTTNGIFKTDKTKSKIIDLSGTDGTGRKYWDWFVRIFPDESGNIWALNTEKGLFRYDPLKGALIRHTDTHKYPGIYFCDLNKDRKGRFWLIQSRTLSIADSAFRNIWDVYYSSSLSYDEPQSYMTRTGEMLLLCGDRFFSFPSEIRKNPYVPPVYITSLIINGTSYVSTFPGTVAVEDLRKIDLSYRYDDLEIGFAALDYQQPDRNRFRYFMEGLDKDTVDLQSYSPAHYRNIRPGNYKFWVTGSNNDGIWNYTGDSLIIKIHPPFYFSRLAFIIYILAFIMGVGIYIRRRLSNLKREKEQLEAEVKNRTIELEVKNRQLEEMDKTKTRFFTNISHEIRTPLTLIMGPIDTLSRKIYGNGNGENLLLIMKRNAQRLMHLVNQMLDISKLDSGKMKIILNEDDIIRKLRTFAYEFLSLAETKQIKYIVDIPEKSFITFYDEEKTEQIMTNLLSNAFKFTPSDGMVECKIRIDMKESEIPSQYVEIKVIDTGLGIHKEEQDKIFDRFYRVEAHHDRDIPGTGIGLALTREYVTILHGTIDLQSEPGTGTQFLVRIPLGKAHLSEEEYVIAGSAHKDEYLAKRSQVLERIDSLSQITDQNKITILIAEDNADLRKFIRQSFNNSYNIIESESGKTALDLARTMMPDLIIMDIMIPGTDGISVCSELKNDEMTSHIPVVMLTARATIEDKLAGLRSGADDYIVKPFEMEELKTRIENLLDSREKLRRKYTSLNFIENPGTRTESIDDKFMIKIVRIINENIMNFDFDAGSLHSMTGISRVHLFRKMKAITGLPPSIFIRNMRLEKAARLILNKSGNITEVANSVGISNPSYFSKCFRDHFGISPKDYSKQ